MVGCSSCSYGGDGDRKKRGRACVPGAGRLSATVFPSPCEHYPTIKAAYQPHSDPFRHRIYRQPRISVVSTVIPPSVLCASMGYPSSRYPHTNRKRLPLQSISRGSGGLVVVNYDVTIGNFK